MNDDIGRALGVDAITSTPAASVRVLILGGTAEARELARALDAAGVLFTSSLAGRVSRPHLPAGAVRIGGFGGVDGLVAFLQQGRFTHVIDATHPFAVGMRRNAVQASAQLNLPIVRLARPGWGGRPDATTWRWVTDIHEADAVSAVLGGRPFITSGRQTLSFFSRLRNRETVVRVVEPLAPRDTPAVWTVLLDRGPFHRDSELRLMREHHIEVLITKDSGGTYTSAKLDAASALGIPVVVVARPPSPQGLAELPDVTDVVHWLNS